MEQGMFQTVTQCLLHTHRVNPTFSSRERNLLVEFELAFNWNATICTSDLDKNPCGRFILASINTASMFSEQPHEYILYMYTIYNSPGNSICYNHTTKW